jgi:hypothetical protein
MDLPEVPVKGPRRLRRQTNEWLNYFGDYSCGCVDSSACAEIVTKLYDVNGHILEVPVNSAVLHNYPTRKEVKEVQCNVRDKVVLIYTQLEIFAENGLITWKKETGGAEIRYRDEIISLRFKLCETTSMFHVIAVGSLDNFASFIYCLRMLFITPGFFVDFEFELTQEDVDRANAVTLEPSLANAKEEEPEWLNDTNADWKP